MKHTLTLLTALLLAPLAALHAADADFDPCDFGAKADGQTLNTKAIQAAIDACAKAGGGRVVLHQGPFRSGTLRLGSNVILHIEAGATLVGCANVDDYPSTPSRHPSYTGELVTAQMLLHAEDARNIGIEGPGRLRRCEETGDHGSESAHATRGPARAARQNHTIPGSKPR